MVCNLNKNRVNYYEKLIDRIGIEVNLSHRSSEILPGQFQRSKSKIKIQALSIKWK